VAIEPGEQIGAKRGGFEEWHRDKLYAVQAKLAGGGAGDPGGPRGQEQEVRLFLHSQLYLFAIRKVPLAFPPGAPEGGDPVRLVGRLWLYPCS
jgi:hypothetical protein